MKPPTPITTIASVLVGCLLIILGIYYHPNRDTRKIDVKAPPIVYIAIDSSASMRANNSDNRDASNRTRFDTARDQVATLLDQLAGQSVGLIQFAGDARIHTPLTKDHAYINQQLQQLRILDAWPGSNIASALLAAYRGFLNQAGRPVLVVISDGEITTGDTQSMIRLLNTIAARVITVGIGSESGEPIPTDTGFLRHDAGDIIVSRLERDNLVTISQQTAGAYSQSPDSIYPAIMNPTRAPNRAALTYPKTVWPLYCAGIICLIYGLRHVAWWALLLLIISQPTDASIMAYWARYYSKGAAITQQYPVSEPNNTAPDWHFQAYGQYLYELGNLDGALVAFKNAQDLYGIASVYYAMADYETAYSYSLRALARTPTNRALIKLAEQCYYAQTHLAAYPPVSSPDTPSSAPALDDAYADSDQVETIITRDANNSRSRPIISQDKPAIGPGY